MFSLVNFLTRKQNTKLVSSEVAKWRRLLKYEIFFVCYLWTS